ncbi:MAG: DUF350 domain-containing protein [Pseudomonadales bacterium]
MEWDFLIATLINLGLNLAYTILALVVGVIALRAIDRRLLTRVDIEAELKAGNMAVAVFASTVLIFVALIVAFGFRG